MRNHSLLILAGVVVFTVAMVMIHHVFAPMIVHRWGIIGTVAVIGWLLYLGAVLDRRH